MERMEKYKSRAEIFDKIFENQPEYRKKQAIQGLFNPAFKSWDDVSSLSKDLRSALKEQAPYFTVHEFKIMNSKDKRTNKAILTLEGGLKIETVLMENARGQFTVCVSAQVGCAMGCVFCATGKMGLFRNLSADEIIDQYRFWAIRLAQEQEGGAKKQNERKITNIVFMGMGEPLMNYTNVRWACRMLLEYTEIGPTHIVVSTVGVKYAMEKMLKDPEWPPVRVAISLHSAIEKTRKEIVPSHAPGFLEFLIEWGAEYHEKYPERSRHLSLEYVLLSGINDTPEHAVALVKFASRMGKVRVNLIFWNPVRGANFQKSIPQAALRMQNALKHKDIMCTIRDTQGQDIEAACGQLILEENKLQENKKQK